MIDTEIGKRKQRCLQSVSWKRSTQSQHKGGKAKPFPSKDISGKRLEDESNPVFCIINVALTLNVHFHSCISKTYTMQLLTKRSDTWSWLPVAIGPSGFLLIIIIVAEM